jgi:hypothetical protein
MTARVNLLPRELEERARARRTTSWAIGAVAAYAALLGVVYIVKLGAVNDARQERDDAENTVAQLEAELASLQEFEELDRQLTARNQLLSASMATEISWARVLNDLSLTFPPSSSLLTLNADAAGAAAAGVTDTTADPNSQSIATVIFDGYSVERFAPGVERVLVKFDEVTTFFNSYLSQASEAPRGDTEVTTFTGTVQLNDEAYTGRYAEGLPPEVGR